MFLASVAKEFGLKKQLISILIADGDPIIRQCIRHAASMEAMLLDVWEAENGLQALMIAKDKRPDLILIDAQLPRMDGMETTRCLRQWLITSKVIIISDHSQSEELARESGADEFVLKDSCCDVLRALLHRMLESD